MPTVDKVTANNPTFTVANVTYSGSVGELYIYNSTSSSASFSTDASLPVGGSAVGYVIGKGGDGSQGYTDTSSNPIGGGGGGGGGVVLFDISSLTINSTYSISVTGLNTIVSSSVPLDLYIAAAGGNGGGNATSGNGSNGNSAFAALTSGKGGGGGGATDTTDHNPGVGGDGGLSMGAAGGDAGSSSDGTGGGGAGGAGAGAGAFPFSVSGSWPAGVLSGAFGVSGTGSTPSVAGTSATGYGGGGGGHFDGSTSKAGNSGAVLIWVKYPLPTKPANVTGSVTSSSINVSGTTAQTSIFSATFYLYDSSSNPIVDSSSNPISYTDSSGSGSGTFGATFSGLSPLTTYNIGWALRNAGGLGTVSDLEVFTTTNTIAPSGNPPCFARGSKILCLNQGLREEYIPIEEIKKGDLVKTLKGSYIKVHTIGKTNFKNPDNADRGPNRLFKLTPAKYPGLTEDLIITGCHSILVDKLSPKQEARHLQLMDRLYATTGKARLMAFIDEKAEPYIAPGDHEIWHLALENTDPVCNYGIYASGLLVETASIKNMTERSGLVLIE